MECYLKGVWVGLIASADEVVHDASGERPFFLIEKLQRRVFSEVLGQSVLPSFSFTTPNGTKFDATDLLNSSAHMTVSSILAAHYTTPQQFMQFHFQIDKLMVGHNNLLHDVADQLKKGKSRKQIIADLRSGTSQANSAP
jgi:hypothetical protein